MHGIYLKFVLINHNRMKPPDKTKNCRLLSGLCGLFKGEGQKRDLVIESLKTELQECLEDMEVEFLQEGALRLTGSFKSEYYDGVTVYIQNVEGAGDVLFQTKFSRNPILVMRIEKADVMDTIERDPGVHDYVESHDSRFDSTFLMRANQEFGLTERFRELMLLKDVRLIEVDNLEVSMEVFCDTSDIKDYLELLVEFGESVWYKLL